MVLKLELSHQKIRFGCLFRGLRGVYPVALSTAVEQHHWTTLGCRSHVPHPPDCSPLLLWLCRLLFNSGPSDSQARSPCLSWDLLLVECPHLACILMMPNLLTSERFNRIPPSPPDYLFRSSYLDFAAYKSTKSTIRLTT